MIEIFPETKIYVACPANTATGGPESLHQLAYHLINDLGIKAYIYYYNFDSNRFKTPVHPEYEFYKVPYITNKQDLEDDNKNILIVPEILSGILQLYEYRNIRKVIWWLSVDNFYLSFIFNSKKNYFLGRVINKISKKIFNKIIFDIPELALKKINSLKLPFEIQNLIKNSNFYLVQGFYALDHIKNKLELPENKTIYLSAYLNPEFLKIQTDLSKKENIVAYNPKKGFSFTKKIISSAKDIKFVPLINMSREEVIKTLQKAKVYIDFGYHPGKDRLPREAAILGCCVITGKRGSAAFFEDVPIPDEYKFEDREENIPKIIEKIRDCFENFEERYKDFDYYRQVIKNEPQKFVEDLRKIFVKVEK